MRKRLFSQSLIMLAISLLITALIVCIIFLGGFGGAGLFPVKQGSAASKFIVCRDSKVIYASDKFTAFEQSDIYLSSMENNPSYTYKNIKYRIDRHGFSDGTEIFLLNPQIDFRIMSVFLCLVLIIVFITVYLLSAMFFRRENDRDIILPLRELTEKTKLLQGGNTDINIPDAGCGEIRELCHSIEDLRIRLIDEVYRNKKSDEERQFLLSSVSHDLRTPITSAKGYLEGILDGVADTEEKQKMYVGRAIEKLNIINSMIADLLLYSKLDANRIEFIYQTINAAEYLAAFTSDNKRTFEAEEKSINFINELSGENFIRIDICQFDRVMRNIIENALKYIPPKDGNVDIILRRNISSIIIEVRDNGCGIDESELPKIFDRFYRGEISRSIKGSSGLGLAISKQIIESMNGRIWATSRKGEGTSIIISLGIEKPQTDTETNS